MNALAPSASDLALLLATASILLIPLSIAGIALINTGLGRSRNSAHLMMSSLCVVGIAAAFYVVFGFASQGLGGGPARVISLAGRNWNWIAKAPLFLQGVTAPPGLLTVWMQSLCVALSALIPTGGAAEDSAGSGDGLAFAAASSAMVMASATASKISVQSR